MKITPVTTYTRIFNKSTKINSRKNEQETSFKEPSFEANKKTLLSKKGSIFGRPYIHTDYTKTPKKETVTDYHKKLALGILEKWDDTIPPENLKNIVTPEEFKKILPNLKEENFTFSNFGFNTGSYFIDLDSNTAFSNGEYSLYELMETLADFSDKYYEQNGKEFIFALTDRDSVESTQQAIRMIGKNPERFKHLKFIPAVKLTFAHEAPTSNIGYENSEMLVYGINPFEEKLVNFVDNSISKRYKMLLNFIRKISSLYPDFAYSVTEFIEQNKLKYSKHYTVSNLYWRAREYAEKGGTTIKGIKANQEQTIKQAHKLINELDEVYTASNNRQRQSTFVDEDQTFNKSIQEVFDKYSTHYDSKKGKIVSAAENLFEEMIKCFKDEEDKPVIAFSAPYYLSHYFEEAPRKDFKNVIKFLDELKEKSNGMLMAFETLVPRYSIDKDLKQQVLEEFNNYIRENTDFYEVGGSFINDVL